MKWELIGAYAEVIGAIAVIVSILYLALQVRDNTRSVRANAGFEAAHSWAISNEILYQAPEKDRMVFARAFDLGESVDKFSESERIHISILMRSLFEKLEGQYYLLGLRGFMWVNSELDQV